MVRPLSALITKAPVAVTVIASPEDITKSSSAVIVMSSVASRVTSDAAARITVEAVRFMAPAGALRSIEDFDSRAIVALFATNVTS
jgi:hypothetical protein